MQFVEFHPGHELHNAFECFQRKEVTANIHRQPPVHKLWRIVDVTIVVGCRLLCCVQTEQLTQCFHGVETALFVISRNCYQTVGYHHEIFFAVALVGVGEKYLRQRHILHKLK